MSGYDTGQHLSHLIPCSMSIHPSRAKSPKSCHNPIPYRTVPQTTTNTWLVRLEDDHDHRLRLRLSLCLSVSSPTTETQNNGTRDNRATQGIKRIQWKPSALCSPVPNRTPACMQRCSGAAGRICARPSGSTQSMKHGWDSWL
jgi:hypothetical protein